MQDYIGLAQKNGVELIGVGSCQFCGANTQKGIHECIEIFNVGFQVIDFSDVHNHAYRFLIVDAHTLQHPEIHGRWSNHFHLSRLHLIFDYDINWTYELSPKLSDHLNRYKSKKKNEYLFPPEVLDRGKITAKDISEKSNDEIECKALIKQWAYEVYHKWNSCHSVVDEIAKGFINR